MSPGHRVLLVSAFTFRLLHPFFNVKLYLNQRPHFALEKDEAGRLKMTITLPDESILDNMAKSLAQILGSGLVGPR